MKLTRALAALIAGYAVGIRPRMLRWGAIDEEIERAYPGADLVPGGRRSLSEPLPPAERASVESAVS